MSSNTMTRITLDCCTDVNGCKPKPANPAVPTHDTHHDRIMTTQIQRIYYSSKNPQCSVS